MVRDGSDNNGTHQGAVITLDDPVAEMERLLEHADQAGLPIRAVGGVAVWLRCPSLRSAQPARSFRDLDVAGLRRYFGQLGEFFPSQGYQEHRRFNTMAGGERMLFTDPDHGRRVDVFLNKVEMCHTLDFRHRLDRDPATLTLADLLLSKLQIVELTDRDALDVAAILADHPLDNGPRANGNRSRETIELGRMAEVCCADWGWWRTVTGNLVALPERWQSIGVQGPDLAVAARGAAGIVDFLERAPKSVRWKTRALIGDRLPWYTEPEEVR